MTTTPEPPVPPPGDEPAGHDAEAAPWSDGQPQHDVAMEADET